MPRHHRTRLTALAVVVGLCACGETSRLPSGADIGPRPALAAPQTALLPTVNIAPAIGWKAGQTPTPAAGLQVHAWAEGLSHPRWLLVLPNGDVLVAESNAPPRPQDAPGIKGWVMKQVQRRAGAGVPRSLSGFGTGPRWARKGAQARRQAEPGRFPR